MSVAGYTPKIRGGVGVAAFVVLALAGLLLLFVTDIPIESILTIGFVNRSLVAASPIALVAIGGLYAEKSGVFNIGVEGFMIFGAIIAATTVSVLGGGSPTQIDLWLAIAVSVAVTLLLTVLFAILVIQYKADQIVAGLAVWFIGLGFAPFTANVVWDSINSPGLVSMNRVVIPYFSEIPVLGSILFNQSPLVLLTILLTVVAWGFLYHTRYGYWIQAAGENPKALDTAGVDVNRVRYSTVIFSGAIAGLAGAVLLAHAGNFIGTGDTMVDGRGWIGIVAYLFGNYNPIGAAVAALLFGALDMLQVQFQVVGIEVSNRLMGILPYVAVVVVLTVWGKTRIPSSVGDSYESEE